ncbi:MAG: VWA domain-containing protein, partial [Oligoflexales bacterium]|nr:VWA domain-containing protein [Oligoflexales bacterium]
EAAKQPIADAASDKEVARVDAIFDNALAPLREVKWQLDCKKEKVAQTPSKDPLKPLIFGEGEHRITSNPVGEKVPLGFYGSVCQNEKLLRDIVFVVDVSGSMGSSGNFSDPRRGDGGCGRLDAVKAIMEKYEAMGNFQFALTTFATETAFEGSAFYPNQGELFSASMKQASKRSIGDILCASTTGTNYNTAFESAKRVLQKGRDNATKEIYFISDGAPDPSNLDGISIAAALKKNGITLNTKSIPVTIATIMLKGNDTLLRNSIASKKPDGTPLHAFVSDSAGLVEALHGLTFYEVTKAEIEYSIGGAPPVKVDVLSHMDKSNNMYSIPEITLTKADSAKPVTVKYSYWDNKGEVTTLTGTLIFSE